MTTISEKDFERQVIDLAHLYGWTVAHFRPARVKDGWRTPVAADGAGFPDLICVNSRVIYVELKSEKGQLSPTQHDWIERLRDANQAVYVWRPSDWDEIVDVLKTDCIGGL